MRKILHMRQILYMRQILKMSQIFDMSQIFINEIIYGIKSLLRAKRRSFLLSQIFESKEHLQTKLYF